MPHSIQPYKALRAVSFSLNLSIPETKTRSWNCGSSHTWIFVPLRTDSLLYRELPPSVLTDEGAESTLPGGDLEHCLCRESEVGEMLSLWGEQRVGLLPIAAHIGLQAPPLELSFLEGS